MDTTGPDVDPTPEQLLDNEVPRHLRREFLLQAASLNLALLSTVVGILTLGFTGADRAGLALVISGVVLLGLTAWRYVHHAP